MKVSIRNERKFCTRDVRFHFREKSINSNNISMLSACNGITLLGIYFIIGEWKGFTPEIRGWIVGYCKRYKITKVTL